MTEKSQKKIKLRYKIVKISTSQFSFVEVDEVVMDDLFSNEKKISLDIAVAMGIDNEKSEISFEVNTSFINLQSQEVVLKHTGKTIFLIDHLEEAYNKEENHFDLPNELMVQLYALSYSHARALLATELKGTMYKDKFYLPVIDPTEIIKN